MTGGRAYWLREGTIMGGKQGLAAGLGLFLTGAALAQMGQGSGLDGGLPPGGLPGGEYPASLPAAAPDVPYQLDPASVGAGIGNDWFDPRRDTPAFSNVANDFTNGGTCGGICILVLDWYSKFVEPIRDQWSVFHGDQGLTVENELGVPGPVHRGNLETYRLRAYTRPEATRPKAVRIAIRNQVALGRTRDNVRFDSDDEDNHEFVWDEIREDIEDPDERLGPIWYRVVRPTGARSAHAVLAYQAYPGTATATAGGRREPVYRVHVFDPNVVVTDQNHAAESAKRTFVYFTRAEKFSFSPAYQQVWTRGRRTVQTGTFIAPKDIGYLDYQSSSFRSDMDRMMRWVGDPTKDVPDSAFQWTSDEQLN